MADFWAFFVKNGSFLGTFPRILQMRFLLTGPIFPSQGHSQFGQIEPRPLPWQARPRIRRRIGGFMPPGGAARPPFPYGRSPRGPPSAPRRSPGGPRPEGGPGRPNVLDIWIPYPAPQRGPGRGAPSLRMGRVFLAQNVIFKQLPINSLRKHGF